ncbi:hypothetical protein FP76_gp089 [Bacillus phage Evoli]|uniref:Uncharacterized protein n=1 Tax=Bacillus phage Evoli TaxID=1486658 RepID=A0A024B0K9_9CAUD|nr:hypothetical protein FP76_gp089 [Bacillus phage Evoli]AHZ10005.1 hypothetical protein [Bacillus phage Evoli]
MYKFKQGKLRPNGVISAYEWSKGRELARLLENGDYLVFSMQVDAMHETKDEQTIVNTLSVMRDELKVGRY